MFDRSAGSGPRVSLQPEFLSPGSHSRFLHPNPIGYLLIARPAAFQLVDGLVHRVISRRHAAGSFG
jgi:hypothetical protein